MVANSGPGMNQPIHKEHWNTLETGEKYTIYAPTAREDPRESIWQLGIFTGRRNRLGLPIFRSPRFSSSGIHIETLDGNLNQDYYYPQDFSVSERGAIYTGWRGRRMGGKRKTRRRVTRRLRKQRKN